MTGLPTMKVIRMGVYDRDGRFSREIPVREDGTFEPFDVAAGEMVVPVVDRPGARLPIHCPSGGRVTP